MHGKEVDIKFWWENMKEIDHFEYLDIDSRIILICIIKKEESKM
jgi:hypothetical protein